MQELDEAMTDWITEPALDSPEAQGFALEDDGAASWAFRTMARYQGEIDRLAALAAAERERIDEWERDASAGARGKVEWFRSLLDGYLHRLHAANPDMPKTYRVPGGALCRTEHRQSRLEVEDEHALVEWALASGAFELLSAKASKTACKVRFAEAPQPDGTSLAVDVQTGEVVPGARFVAPETTYSVRPD